MKRGIFFSATLLEKHTHTAPWSMELFAATTGCQDPAVASLYLERADNDVSRAVNFFFDAPPDAAGVGYTPTTTSISGSDYSTASHPRSLKRQRSEFAEGKQQQQQPQLMPERARPSMAGGSTVRQGVASTEPSHDRDGFAAAAPSAEWTRTAESCVRCDRPLERLRLRKKIRIDLH